MPIRINHNSNHFLEVEFQAPVVRQDIEKLKKQMQVVANTGQSTNLMWHIQKLSDFTYRALLSLIQLGFSHWRGFHKVAVISEDPEVDLNVRWQNFFVLWQMRCFSKQQIEIAQNWLSA